MLLYFYRYKKLLCYSVTVDLWQSYSDKVDIVLLSVTVS